MRLEALCREFFGADAYARPLAAISFRLSKTVNFGLIRMRSMDQFAAHRNKLL
jgi:hypothetical protein